MTYQVVFTLRAKKRMQKIYERLKTRSSLHLANKVRNNLFETAHSLSENPQKLPTEQDINYAGIEFRKITTWRYNLIFTIEESALQVIIVEVLVG